MTEFVAWWEREITPGHGAGRGNKKISGLKSFSADKATELTGIKPMQRDLAQEVPESGTECATPEPVVPWVHRSIFFRAERAAAKELMSEGARVGKVSTPSKTRDKIGVFAGVSGRTVEVLSWVRSRQKAA